MVPTMLPNWKHLEEKEEQQKKKDTLILKIEKREL